MNMRDQQSRYGLSRTPLNPVLLILAAALLCWAWGISELQAQTNEPDDATSGTSLYSEFFERLRSDEAKTVIFRWQPEERVLVDGWEQQLTGEQIRIDSTGETYTVFYSEDGEILEGYSARRQIRWPNGLGDENAPEVDLPENLDPAAKPALPPTGPLFEGNPVESVGYYAVPVLDPSRRDPRYKTEMRKRPVKVDAKSLIDFSPASGRTLKIDLFNGVSVEAEFDRLQQTSSFSYAMTGLADGDPTSDVTLSVYGNAVAGRVVAKGKGTYFIRAVGDVGYVAQIDESQFAGCGADESLRPPGVASASPTTTSSSWTTTDSAAPTASAAGDIAPDEIFPGERGFDLGLSTSGPGAGGVYEDLLVVYTPRVLTMLQDALDDVLTPVLNLYGFDETPLSLYYGDVTGGEVDGIDQALELLQALVHLEVFDLNISLINSLVTHRMRLVHIEEVLHEEILAQDEEGNNYYDTDDLEALANPADGIMDLIHNTRDAFGADFVHLITEPPFEDPAQADRFLPRSLCGVAYIRPSFDDFSDLAFGVTLAECFGNLVVAHEIGHNHGLAHNRINADVIRLHSYALGYFFIGNTGFYRTVMSYQPPTTETYSRIRYFSNPNVFFDGVPTGVPIGQPLEAHNAQSWQLSGPSSSTWRTAVVQNQLEGISTRGFVGTGNNVLIGGFTLFSEFETPLDPNDFIEQEISDASSGEIPVPADPGVLKRVLILGRGPSLASAGLGGVLGNPMITLFDSNSDVVATNLNWQDADAAAIAATGKAPSHPNESAILTYLPADSYTVQLQGQDGGSGLGIIEIYALDGPDGTAKSVRQFGISTRGFVGTGDSVMIGGILVQGTSPTNVALFARAPSLVGALPDNQLIDDPILEVYSGPTLIATSDNWVFESSATALNSLGAGPPSSLEAAVLLTLTPGPYTVIVRGKGSPSVGVGTGLAIVEAYEVVGQATADVQVLVDGVTQTPSFTLDFGNVPMLSSATKSVTIVSTGAVDLQLSPFNSQVKSPFSSGSGTIGTVLPTGASETYTFTFTSPTSIGQTYTKTINIPTNDPDTPVITIKLKGRTVLPVG